MQGKQLSKVGADRHPPPPPAGPPPPSGIRSAEMLGDRPGTRMIPYRPAAYWEPATKPSTTQGMVGVPRKYPFGTI